MYLKHIAKRNHGTSTNEKSLVDTDFIVSILFISLLGVSPLFFFNLVHLFNIWLTFAIKCRKFVFWVFRILYITYRSASCIHERINIFKSNENIGSPIYHFTKFKVKRFAMVRVQTFLIFFKQFKNKYEYLYIPT